MEKGNLITILYVDDEEVNLMVFELNFNNLYKVYTANSGRIGLDILDKP